MGCIKIKFSTCGSDHPSRTRDSRVHGPQDGHRDDLIALCEADAPDAGGIPAREDPHLVHRKSDAAAEGRGQEDVVLLGPAQGDADDGVPLVELHGDLAVAVDLGEVAEPVPEVRD